MSFQINTITTFTTFTTATSLTLAIRLENTSLTVRAFSVMFKKHLRYTKKHFHSTVVVLLGYDGDLFHDESSEYPTQLVLPQNLCCMFETIYLVVQVFIRGSTSGKQSKVVINYCHLRKRPLAMKMQKKNHQDPIGESALKR